MDLYKLIPYNGENEEFLVNITLEELQAMKDDHGTIRYHKVLEWCLPRFPDIINGGTLSLFV